MIVNIRGTNGSGKTQLVWQFMQKYGSIPIYMHRQGSGLPVLRYGGPPRPNKEIFGYYAHTTDTRIVGRYTTACGGCDTIKTQAETKQLVETYAALGHVLFEGILVSTIFGPWLEFSRAHQPFVWAFLDTPLDVCLERIQIRNGGKPVKTDQIKAKWEGMLRVAEKAKLHGETVVSLPYLNALPALERVLVPKNLSDSGCDI